MATRKKAVSKNAQDAKAKAKAEADAKAKADAKLKADTEAKAKAEADKKAADADAKAKAKKKVRVICEGSLGHLLLKTGEVTDDPAYVALLDQDGQEKVEAV